MKPQQIIQKTIQPIHQIEEKKEEKPKPKFFQKK